MKKVALIVALMLSGAASAQPVATSEEVCLSVGRMAAGVADAMHGGVPESKVLEVFTAPTDKPMTPAAAAADQAIQRAVPYIYTMRFDPQQTRTIVYMKCKAGEYAGKGQP